MQQGGSQYGMTTPPPEMTTPFSTTASSVSATTPTSTTRTHILGLSNSDHLQQLHQEQQQHVHHHQQQISGDAAAVPMVVAEAASPISSRPPQQRGNLDELGMPISSSGYPDDEGLGGEEGERGFSGGNRWPRQETIALLKIRSEMDAAFRDATLKGPLWEDVSRKLAEQGYHRSAKKCKEKFENVHKYYKRTKEGRAGRQDGKSYRFFTQLEALHTSTSNPPTFSTTPTITTAVNPVAVSLPLPLSIGVGMVTSSGRIHPSSESPMPGTAPAQPPPANIQVGATGKMNPPDLSGGILGSAMATSAPAGISFSSNTSSSESESDHEDDMEEDEGGPSNTTSRKRKRGSGDASSSSSRRMMDFFEGLMKQVMEKQEAMQQRFLETIEKREQDRMIREEAWKRQEMARLNREHEIIAQERAISAARDASIITFLQKLTGQTIQLPQQPVVIPAAPPPVPPQAQPQCTPPPPSATALVQTVPIQTQAQAQTLAPSQQQQHQHHIHHHQRQEQQQQPQQQISQPTEIARHQAVSTDMVVAAIPEQQHLPSQELVVVGGSGGGGSLDPSSSRWPKPEVLALIKLRSGLESRYQEAGPKGPLWEEISAGMQRMGYNRSSKRCKEKWENINKYFKKVKESNKKRPEDAKTCPYFHQLDALYRKKMLGSGSGGSSGSVGNPNKQEQQHETMPAGVDPNAATNFQAIMAAPPQQQPQQPTVQAIEAEMKNKNYNNSNTNSERLFQEGNSGSGVAAAAAAVKKPEDININIMKELIDLHQQQQLSMDDCDKLEEPDSDNLDHDDEEDDEEDEEEDEEETKMAYKIQFQRQNAGSSSNGGGGGNSHFLAMVQ